MFVKNRQRDKSTETDHGEKTDCENGRLANNTVIMLACGITIWLENTHNPLLPLFFVKAIVLGGSVDPKMDFVPQDP